jgi:hypothetical protein
MVPVDRADVERWVADYERMWRSPGTGALGELFAAGARYLPSPWAEPLDGLAAITAFWEAERDGADEVFRMASELVALDGPTAVVRVAVDYGDYGEVGSGRWRDLWVLRFDDTGRCTSFEEWPFAPGQPDGHD